MGISIESFVNLLYMVLISILGLSFVIALYERAWKTWLKRKAKTNHPLDDSLRDLVASERTWENCVYNPDFCEEILRHFRFLVDDLGFRRPRLSATELMFKYRRGDIELQVAWEHGHELPALHLVLYRSDNSFYEIDRRDLSYLRARTDSGYRGLIFTLRQRLDKEIASLREGARAM